MLNLIVGRNGIGKTSVLDSIHCLSFGKSYFSSQDQYLLKDQSEFYRLEGDFTLDEERKKISLAWQPGKRRKLTVQGKSMTRLADYLGCIPVLCIAPSDIELVNDSSTVRRSFIDKLISQIDKEYLIALTTYNRILKQRNAVLKSQAGVDHRLLSTFDQQMQEPAQEIHKKRLEYVRVISDIFSQIHPEIVEDAEDCMMTYRSQLSDMSWQDGVEGAKHKDLSAKRSTFGIHKDDLIFQIRNQPLKNAGSQGQIKSFVFGLKMAEYKILSRETGKQPIVLLDDIFDKLDDQRATNIVKYMLNQQSQVFISDTSPDRLVNLLDQENQNHQVIHLQ